MKIPKRPYGIPFLLWIIMVLGLAYIWIFGRATTFIWSVKKEVAKDPTMAMIPVPLLDNSIPNSEGTTLSKFGYQFEVPWKMKEIKRGSSFVGIFESESGQELLSLWNPLEFKGSLKELRESLGPQFAGMVAVYGTAATRSDYDFDQAIAYATPAQLSYFMPHNNEVRAGVFLLLKPIVTSHAETGFFSFKTDRLKGLQNGDPAKTKTVVVRAYDAEDRKFEFTFAEKPASTGSISQSDINMVLQTLRPAPASPLEPAVK